MYTVSLNNRTLGVCSEERYEACDLARRYLLAEGLLQGRVTLVDGLTQEELTPPKRAGCPCSCHCGEYSCDECYEDVSPAVHTGPPASPTESEDSSTDELQAQSQEETLLPVWPAATPDSALDGVALRYTAEGNLELLRVHHREQSYLMFWTATDLRVERLAELRIRRLS
jgi:hypothetical protein